MATEKISDDIKMNLSLKHVNADEIQTFGEDPSKIDTSSLDPLLAAWVMILQSVAIGRENAVTLTKSLNNSTERQSHLIDIEAGFAFETLSKEQVDKGVKQETLQNMQAHNQLIGAQTDIIGDKINVNRQGAQVNSTSINTTANEVQQTVQEGTSIMQLLRDITNLILR